MFKPFSFRSCTGGTVSSFMFKKKSVGLNSSFQSVHFQQGIPVAVSVYSKLYSNVSNLDKKESVELKRRSHLNLAPRSFSNRHESFSVRPKLPYTQPLALAHTQRPLSPHLTIFKLGLTGNLSILHRFTGVLSTAAFYAVGVLASLGTTSSNLIQWCATMPSPIFWTFKAMLIFPLSYHTLNGIRHLVWDAGYALSVTGVYKSGYVVLGASVLSSLLMLAFY